MTSALHLIAVVLAVSGASLTLACSVGVAVMRDPYLRLHYVGPASTLGSVAIALAFVLDAHQVAPAVKAILVAILLCTSGPVTSHATARVRLVAFAVGAAALLTAVAVAAARLPPRYPGPYGTVLDRVAVSERHTTDVVASVTYDYRGFDTLGEEVILFASVAGAVLLLRRTRSQWEGAGDMESLPDRTVAGPSDAVRLMSLALVPVAVVFGSYLTLHGQVSPGGGFQAGVVLASAPLLVYLGTRARTLIAIAPPSKTELGEGAGISGYAAVGLAGLFVSGSYLENVLPLGTPADVFSSGTILVLSCVVSLAVGAGLVLMLVAFVAETLRQEGTPR